MNNSRELIRPKIGTLLKINPRTYEGSTIYINTTKIVAVKVYKVGNSVTNLYIETIDGKTTYCCPESNKDIIPKILEYLEVNCLE